jgi:hypothetical protein
MLPNRLFFTGVPGSKWSGVAQQLERHPAFNTSDRTPERTYTHGSFSGHVGAYFGKGMEFDSSLVPAHLDQAWATQDSCRIVKSHEWSMSLPQIKGIFPDDWIMLVSRDAEGSYSWWKQAGGFDIKYPKYDAYINDAHMKNAIYEQTKAIKSFAKEKNLTWYTFTPKWVKNNFDLDIEIDTSNLQDVFVTLLK